MGTDTKKDQGDMKNIENNGHVSLYGNITENGTDTAIAKAMEPTHGTDIKDPELSCGYGSCAPSMLQRCNNTKTFLVVMCIFSMIQGFVVNGINNVNVSTLERRYQLPSARVGLISSSYDISAAILVIPITYWGAHTHKPRLLAFAALILGLGSLVMCIPQMASGLYELGAETSLSDVCLVEGNNVTAPYCSKENDVLQNYLYVLMLGQFLHGIAGTTLYSIGVVVIDENVKTKLSPLYIGIMYTFSGFGPAIGYIAGGQFLNIYVDVVTNAGISITPADPRWVGAWWIGFAIGCVCSIITAAFLFCYDYEMPEAKNARAERYSQAHADGSEAIVSKKGFGTSIKDLPLSTKFIVMNPTFMCITLAGCSEGLLTSGFATFMPKFIQNQFSQSAGMAALYGGLAAVVGAAGGQFLGGYLSKRFKLKVKGMLRLCLGSTIVCFVLVFSFIAKCKPANISGINVSYFNFSTIDEASLIVPCNQNCNCTSESYEPICGVDGVEYFTPCHAGCADSFFDGDIKRYANCSCISQVGKVAEKAYKATYGKCTQDCNLLALFLPVFCIVVTLTFIATPIAMSVSLRVIPDAQRSYAIGIKWVFIRCLGTVPGPILFGYLFDITCLQWQNKCDTRGSCWVYDSDKLAINLLILGLAVKFVSAILFFLAQFLYKPPNDDNSLSMSKIDSDDSGVDISNGEIEPTKADIIKYTEQIQPEAGDVKPVVTIATHDNGFVSTDAVRIRAISDPTRLH
ncbi:unnamed protein product [Owenia fusiformis]|uniref:Solute carrier organic anion transporter family member n=1 Tax=Owenia fusiformis TaxID=6347 RepID=A0A8S4N3T0_OWEFU|nr:unnamed protein product [Owenia fusiformis]